MPWQAFRQSAGDMPWQAIQPSSIEAEAERLSVEGGGVFSDGPVVGRVVGFIIGERPQIVQVLRFGREGYSGCSGSELMY